MKKLAKVVVSLCLSLALLTAYLPATTVEAARVFYAASDCAEQRQPLLFQRSELVL